MIKVEHLSKKYGKHYAVKDLSFEIEKGKVYGFLGPNGAGKSTTMNIMTGYIAASSGKVEVEGHDIVKDSEEAKKCIGYLPELPPLYQDMTVKEYLDFVAELKKVPKAQRAEQVKSSMQKTFITDMSGRLIKNLSKGYKQRVGLAQAMIGNPGIIILDEPTVGLDPKQIIEIRDLIRQLKKDHTVILSSHILSEVAEVCDQLMIIAKGHLIAAGTEQEIMGELGESNVIDVVIHGSKNAVTAAVSSIADVESVRFANSSDGCVKCSIVYRKGTEIRDELCKNLAANNAAVYEMVNNSKTLEDIFLELTDEKYVDAFIAKKESEAAEENDKKADETPEAETEDTADDNEAVECDNEAVECEAKEEE